MVINQFQRYALSCGLLLIPAFAWNFAFAGVLPVAFSKAIFWQDIPPALALTENLFRTFAFGLPFMMPLELSSPRQQRGLVIFTLGTLVYFGSWLLLMFFPNLEWSTSAIVFTAPAYTPALWLIGLAMIGRRLYWGHFYRWWMYLVIAGCFLTAHIWHTALIFRRTY
jgi:hypothetical protein